MFLIGPGRLWEGGVGVTKYDRKFWGLGRERITGMGYVRRGKKESTAGWGVMVRKE